MIRLSAVDKTYEGPEGPVPVLRDISLEIARGERVALTGASGSGKTSLMNIIGLLDRPSQGYLYLQGQKVNGLKDARLSALRNRTIGFVFQSFHLLPWMSAIENAALPLRYRACPENEARRRAAQALERVGLGCRLHYRPDALSGGQQQRVAIARALVGEPALLLADEPTGNLDDAASAAILDLIERINNDTGVTVLLVTHDASVAARCQRQIRLVDGRRLDSSPAFEGESGKPG